jgi:hypothetical protein
MARYAPLTHPARAFPTNVTKQNHVPMKPGLNSIDRYPAVTAAWAAARRAIGTRYGLHET